MWGNPSRCFQAKTGQIKNRFPTEDFSSQQVLGNNEALKSHLEKHKDNMLAEATSEVRKHESRADYLDSSVRDLQRHLDSNRLEIYCTNQVYEESRDEQARLHE